MTYILLILVVFADEPNVTKLIGSQQKISIEQCRDQARIVREAGDPYNKRKVTGMICLNTQNPELSEVP